MNFNDRVHCTDFWESILLADGECSIQVFILASPNVVILLVWVLRGPSLSS